MRVLVTRPLAQAQATAELLRDRGHEALVDPVLAIEPVAMPRIGPGGYSALVLTSANAVPAVPDTLRGLPLFCVGTVTAAAARNSGLTVAGEASGDGADLARLLARQLKPGRIVHLSGEDRAASLAIGLQGAGFVVDQVVAYRAVPTPTLPQATRAALEGAGLDAVLLLSPRTARIWCRLVQGAGLEAAVSSLLGACLSPAVAEAAGILRWRELRIAVSRDQRALVDSLDGPR